MGYVERKLADGERIVYRTKMSQAVFVWPVVFFLYAFVRLLSGTGYIFLTLTAMSALVVGFMYLRSDFVVTNRRVMGRLPIGNKPECPEVALIELRDVEFKRGILGRAFSYGTLVLTDRQGALHKFPGVPAEFYRQVEARVARIKRILQ